MTQIRRSTAKDAHRAADGFRLEINSELPKAVPITFEMRVGRYLNDDVEMARLVFLDEEVIQDILESLGQTEVGGAAFSPDGKRLATASEDRTVQVYALDPRELLKLARSRVTRPFTADECQRSFQSATCLPLP